MEDLNHFERITAYLEGTLNKVQKKQFEADLESDKDLKSEYDAYLASEQALDILAYQQLEKQTAQLNKEEQKSPTPNKRFSLLRMAASILFLILAGIVIFSNFSYSDNKLATKFYEVPNLSTTRGTATNEEVFTKAVKAFYDKDYTSVVNLLQTVPTTEKTDAISHLLGHAFINLQQAQNAANEFSKLTDQTDEEVRWNKIIIHIQSGDIDQAKKELIYFLKNTSSDYHQDAQQLQEELNSFWRKFCLFF